MLIEGLKPRTHLSTDLIGAGFNTEEIKDFSDALLEGEFDTIDAFIAQTKHSPHWRQIGQCALALLIRSHENRENLFHINNSPQGPKHWYRYLLDFLRSENDSMRISFESFSFVTFNYDRALEHYLFNALVRGNPALRERLIHDFFSSQNFIHVHGHVGYLPWQTNMRPSSDYGASLRGEYLSDVAATLQFPHDQFHMMQAMRELLFSADIIAFLGFGFHEQNLQRLFFNDLTAKTNLRLFGTSYGLSQERLLRLKKCHPKLSLFENMNRDFMRTFLDRLEANSVTEWASSLVGNIEGRDIYR